MSTDEQKLNYSLPDQDERLPRHCGSYHLEFTKVYFEDHSAKNFNRPEWKKLLLDLKKESKNTAVTILVTKWDRFNRNTAEAYRMLRLLSQMKAEVQTIEQPLDFRVPESKLMLAVCLAAPEVDNDRRALDVGCSHRLSQPLQ